MNPKQTSSLSLLVELFSKVRGWTVQTVTAVQPNGTVRVIIDQPDFPEISIGKQGGFGLPGIKSYPENGKESSYAYPGNTALDAVLFADKHLARQANGRKKAVAAVAAPAVVETPTATEPEAAGVTEAAAVDQDELMLLEEEQNANQATS